MGLFVGSIHNNVISICEALVNIHFHKMFTSCYFSLGITALYEGAPSTLSFRIESKNSFAHKYSANETNLYFL